MNKPEFNSIAEKIKKFIDIKSSYYNNQAWKMGISRCLADEIKINESTKEYIINDFNEYIDYMANNLIKLFNQCNNNDDYAVFCELYCTAISNIGIAIQDYSYLVNSLRNEKLRECKTKYESINIPNKPKNDERDAQNTREFIELMAATKQVFDELLKIEELINNHKYDNNLLQRIQIQIDWHEKTFMISGEIHNAETNELISKCPIQDSEVILNKISQIKKMINTYGNNIPQKNQSNNENISSLYIEFNSYYKFIKNNPLVGMITQELINQYEDVLKKTLDLESRCKELHAPDDLLVDCENLINVIRKRLDSYGDLIDNISSINKL